jgi:hypothetical protein
MYRIVMIAALWAMLTAGAPGVAPLYATESALAGIPANAPEGIPANAPECTTAVALAVTLDDIPAGVPADALEGASKVVPESALLVVPAGKLDDAPVYGQEDVPEVTTEDALVGAPESVLGCGSSGTLANSPADAAEFTSPGAQESALIVGPEGTPLDSHGDTHLDTLADTLADTPVGALAGDLTDVTEDALAIAPENIPAVIPLGVAEGITAVAMFGDPPVASAFAESDTPPGDPVPANSGAPAKVPEGEAPGAPAKASLPILAGIAAHTSEYLNANTPADVYSNTPEQPSLLRTDSLTYALYLSKEWKALLTETNKALSAGIDFYYLRVRAGIAAYELKNYRLAAKHLAKAYEWNTSDELVNYWYYYALLMGSRADEANALAEYFSPQFMQRMEIRPKSGVNALMAEAQVSVNSGHASLLEDAIGGDNSYLAYRNVLKRQTYKGFGIDHRVAPRLYAFHGISHLGIDRMQMYRSPTLDYQYESSAWQFQYYLQGRYLLPKGWSVTSAATLLWGSALSHWLSFNNSGVALRNASTYSISDAFLSASVAKELTRLRPKLSVSYGNVNGYRQLQATGQLILYPAGNPNFYLSAGYTLHNDESDPDLKTIFSPRAGLKTGPLWWSAGGSTGVMKNFSASDGYVVYNMPESISGLYDISVYLPLLKYRLGVTARYQVADKEGSTFDYSNTTNYTTAPYTFTENSFLISIRYNL